jgi:hypothetical protein
MRNFLTLTATPHAVLDCPVKERPFGEASLTESQAHHWPCSAGGSPSPT